MIFSRTISVHCHLIILTRENNYNTVNDVSESVYSKIFTYLIQYINTCPHLQPFMLPAPKRPILVTTQT